jgi:hypothetical protein
MRQTIRVSLLDRRGRAAPKLPENRMSTHSIRLALAAALCAIAGHDAMAASQRTFVASYGLDTNACTLLAPCRSFATALAQTVPGGETVVLDSAGYGPFTVGQAATILAPAGVYAGISVFSGAGITVSAGAADKVTLRGLTINSISGTQGIVYSSGAALYLDNVIVTGFTSGAGAGGLVAAVAAGGSVYVIDSAFRDNSVGASFTAGAGTLTVISSACCSSAIRLVRRSPIVLRRPCAVRS